MFYIKIYTFCQKSLFIFFLRLLAQRVSSYLYSITLLVFITEAECVY